MPTNSKEYMKANYGKYWGTSKAIKDRSMRNSARRLMIKKGKVSKGDGKEVDHKSGVDKGNGSGNLRVLSRLRNRINGQKKAMKNRTHKYNITK